MIKISNVESQQRVRRPRCSGVGRHAHWVGQKAKDPLSERCYSALCWSADTGEKVVMLLPVARPAPVTA
ncbi:hypothetical protein GN956_G25620 [Arapaima gigas]